MTRRTNVVVRSARPFQESGALLHPELLVREAALQLPDDGWLFSKYVPGSRLSTALGEFTCAVDQHVPPLLIDHVDRTTASASPAGADIAADGPVALALPLDGGVQLPPLSPHTRLPPTFDTMLARVLGAPL